MKTFLLGLTLLLFNNITHAAEITVHKSKVVVFDGEIKKGDATKFYDILHNSDVNGVIVLQSVGGDVAESLLIAQMVSTYRLVTVVGSGCYSACAFVFFASESGRVISDKAEIGIHVPHLKIGGSTYDENPNSPTWWSLYGFMRGAGMENTLATKIVDKIYSTPSKELFIINKENAKEYGITVKEDKPKVKEGK